MAFDSLRASHHASPLRYPGGKAKLAPYLKRVLRENKLLDCTYAEPFAGGVGAGLALLLHGYVRQVVINDLSLPIFAFWHSALNNTQSFCDLILSTKVDRDEWERQRAIFVQQSEDDILGLGFSTFFLNRTNHSGVLNGGMIGGKAQTSTYGIDARFNRQELVARIRRLEKFRSRIQLCRQDAASFIKNFDSKNSFLYVDPPYYVKGRDLYYDFYSADDHKILRDAILDREDLTWVVSYDNVPEISDLYQRYRSIEYDLGYSVRNGGRGREIMFFSDNLSPPAFVAE